MAAVSLGTASSVGCDKGQGTYGKRMGPPPKVIATSLDNYPKVGGLVTEVPHRPLFVVRFDRPLAPSSDARPNFTISSGSQANVAFREIRVDPVEREIVFTIAAPLTTGQKYSLHITSFDDPSNALAAIDGARFEGSLDIPFQVTTDEKEAVVHDDIDPFATQSDLCEAQQNFVSTCAGTNCHGSTESPFPPPAMGLNLSTGQGIQNTAVGHASVLGADEASPAGTGDPSSPSFPFGLPIVRAHQSSSSFLLYKILKHHRPAGDPQPGPYAIAGFEKELDVKDIDDVGALWQRELVDVPGSGMPHETLPAQVGGSPGDAFDWGTIRVIRAWIDAGAPYCAPPTK